MALVAVLVLSGMVAGLHAPALGPESGARGAKVPAGPNSVHPSVAASPGTLPLAASCEKPAWGADPSTCSNPPAISTFPRTASTFVFANDTLVPGNLLAGAGLEPDQVAFDPANGMLYVLEYGSSDLTVINPATNTVIGTISIGGANYGMVLDPAKGELFLSDFGGGTAVVNITTGTVVATVATQSGSWGMAYDSGTHEIFVSDYFTGNVSVISDASNSVVTTISVGAYPVGVTYDPLNGEIFVVCISGATPGVYIVNDTSNTVVGTVPLDNNPDVDLFDPTNGDVYVSTALNVTVLSGSTHAVVVNTTLRGYVEGFAYDSGKNEMFAMTGGGNVTVFNAATNAIITNISLTESTATGFGGIGYDSAQGEVFVTGQLFTVQVLSDSTNTLVANITIGFTPAATAFDSAKNQLFVTSWQYGDQVAIFSTTTDQLVKMISVDTGTVAALYDSGKGEIFIAGDSGVSVVNDTNDSIVASIPIDVDLSGLAYDASSGEVFAVNDATDEVDAINDSSNTITATSASLMYAYAVAYNSGQNQLFVSTGSTENVTVLNASDFAFVSNVTIGSYDAVLGYDSGIGVVYATTYHARAFNILGISDRTDTVVSNASVGGLVFGFAYDPAQGEEYASIWAAGDGQPRANVTVLSDATRSVLATVPVGVTPTGISFDAATEQVFVANYGQGTLSIIGQVPAYTATFSESGLPNGTSWSVDLNGSTEVSTSSSIVFVVVNGTESFTVGSVTGFTPTPASGDIDIEGNFPMTSIQFVASSPTGAPPTKYPVTFTETGLAIGAAWTVALNGSSQSSSSTTIVFTAANGSESFTVGILSGYTTGEASGSILIAGHSVAQTIAFTSSASPSSGKNGSGSPGGFLGLPGAEGYLLLLLVLILIGIVVAVVIRSRRGKPPAAPNDPTGPGSSGDASTPAMEAGPPAPPA
jgi:YVTN family beta-propeller protein